LIGNHENTDVGKFLHEYLDLDLEPITKDLREAVKHKKWSWMHTSKPTAFQSSIDEEWEMIDLHRIETETQQGFIPGGEDL
jgi:hypothetical protein